MSKVVTHINTDNKKKPLKKKDLFLFPSDTEKMISTICELKQQVADLEYLNSKLYLNSLDILKDIIDILNHEEVSNSISDDSKECLEKAIEHIRLVNARGWIDNANNTDNEDDSYLKRLEELESTKKDLLSIVQFILNKNEETRKLLL